MRCSRKLCQSEQSLGLDLMPRFFSAAISFAICLLAHAANAEDALRIVCLGDSVTKAVRQGVLPEETFRAVLERMLA